MGTNERRERERTKRREDIIDAARTLFFDRGFRDTTIDDIARSTELARGTIYLYFENKEEIFAVLMEEALKMLYDLVVRSYDPDLDPLTNLLAGHDAYMKFHDEHPEYYSFMPLDKSEVLALVSDDTKARLDQRYVAMVAWISKILAEGVEQGIFRPLPVAEVAILQMSFSMGYAQMIDKCNKGSSMPIDRDQTRQVLHDLIANGVLARAKQSL